MSYYIINHEKEQIEINFSVGDLIVDNINKCSGVLIERIRRVSIENDDIIVWRVYWSSRVNMKDIITSQEKNEMISLLEEEGLRISVILDFITLIKRGESGNQV